MVYTQFMPLFVVIQNYFNNLVLNAATGATDFYSSVTSALTQLLTWLGSILASLLNSGDLSALLPLFSITIAISLIMLAVRIVRTFAWGA